MALADFQISATQTGQWSIIHAPSAVEILSLPINTFPKVDIEEGPSGLAVMARRVQGDVVPMPIRFGDTRDTTSMLLDVEVLGTQQVLQVNANSTDTMSVLKERLSYKCNIPPAEQSLWFGDIRLDNDRLTVRQTGLHAGGWLRVGRCGKVRVTVRVNPLTVVRLMLLPSNSIEYVKELVARKANVPAERQILLLAGRELPGEATVRDCGVLNGYELNVVNKSGITKRYPRHKVKTSQQASAPLPSGDLNASLEDVLASVHDIVDQQAQLQTAVQSLVTTCSERSPAMASPFPTPYDTVAHSRSLRAAAAVQADSALHMSSKTPYGVAEMKFGHRRGMRWVTCTNTDILHYLQKEASSPNYDHVTAGSLSRMEQVRQEYNQLRHDINMENMKKDDNGCKLCGHSTDKPDAAPVKPSPKASVSTAAKPAAKASSPKPAAKPSSTAVKSTTPSTVRPSSVVKPPAKRSQSVTAVPLDDRPLPKPTSVPLDERPIRPASSVPLDEKPIKPSAKPTAKTSKPAPKKDKDTASQSSDDSVMGDHLLGDPEAVEKWMKEHGRM